MIQIMGMPFQQTNFWPTDTIEQMIVQRMEEDPAVHSFQSINELSFELKLRKNIILSAKALNDSNAQFTILMDSHANPKYWQLTSLGGFLLRPDVKSSEAIKDIYLNSSKYAFECATAMIIIYYNAVLNLLEESVFNQLFQEIYLYSWHADSDLQLSTINTNHFIPGDVVYFNNPDFNPRTSQWRGENAVVLGDDTYFGHGIGIETAEEMIKSLNNNRTAGSYQSAYLADFATRLKLQLANISQRSYSNHKYQHAVLHHNQSSISFYQYLYLFNSLNNNTLI